MHHRRDAELPGFHHAPLYLRKALCAGLRLNRDSSVGPSELAETIFDELLPVKGGRGEIMLVRGDLA